MPETLPGGRLLLIYPLLAGVSLQPGVPRNGGELKYHSVTVNMARGTNLTGNHSGT